MTDYNNNWAPPPPPPPDPSGEIADFAGFWMRVGAHLADGAYIWLVTLPFSIVGRMAPDSLSSLLGLAAAFVGPYVLLRATGQAGGSPFRTRLGVLVVDERDGSFIGIRRAFGRWLASYAFAIFFVLGLLWAYADAASQSELEKLTNQGDVPAGAIVMFLLATIVFLVDNLWMNWDEKRQTLHDKVAKTVVVRR